MEPPPSSYDFQMFIISIFVCNSFSSYNVVQGSNFSKNDCTILKKTILGKEHFITGQANYGTLSDIAWVCLAPRARSEIGAPCPDFFPENFQNGRPKTNFGHFQKWQANEIKQNKTKQNTNKNKKTGNNLPNDNINRPNYNYKSISLHSLKEALIALYWAIIYLPCIAFLNMQIVLILL